jgi:hypothetical protein
MIAKKVKDMNQEKLLLRMYASGTETSEEQFLGGIRDFLERIKGSGETLEAALHEAVVYIEAFFQFKEICIGIKGHDGNFRYAVTIGYNKEAEAFRKAMVFSQRDMSDMVTYRPVRICRVSQFYLSEKKPYRPGAEKSYNRPNLLGIPRQRPDDMIEGDYIEVPLQGKNREVIGWIEAAGSSFGKLPKREVMVQLEFFAACISPVIAQMI